MIQPAFSIVGILGVVLVSACAPESDVPLDEDGHFVAVDGREGVDPATGMKTKTYYVSNPTSAGCSSALKLTAKGTSITKISPSGCVISCTDCGIAPTWDSLTSAGVSTLSDTWYNQSDKFDKDYTSATGQAWCDSSVPVTVVVTGSSITSLSYWFTDDSDCWW